MASTTGATRFGEILWRWTHPSVLETFREEASPFAPGRRGAKHVPIQQVLLMMSHEAFERQLTFAPENIFLVSAQENWNREWVKWVAPTLLSMQNLNLVPGAYIQTPVSSWDSYQIWMDLCGLSPQALAQISSPLLQHTLLKAKAERKYSKLSRNLAHMKTRAVVSPSMPATPPRRLGDHNPAAWNLNYSTPTPRLFVPNGTCPACAGLPPSEQCVFHWPVQMWTHAMLKLSQLENAYVTCAPANDVLNNKKKDVYSPELLGFREICSRPNTLARCGRDIQLLCEGGLVQNTVGGVRFEAMQRRSNQPSTLQADVPVPTLEDMQDGHGYAGHYINREKTPRPERLQATGRLYHHGSRVPMGGIAGDGYRRTAGDTARSMEGIDAMFATAQDNDTLRQCVSSFAPPHVLRRDEE
ncbi:hypothetical protein MKEN_00574300 [Mycena kentingensis (nom. inval.)]|nr:hypothetical protein MKEN_00574300 [Mycena kentingensis (nom. inval.)]